MRNEKMIIQTIEGLYEKKYYIVASPATVDNNPNGYGLYNIYDHDSEPETYYLEIGTIYSLVAPSTREYILTHATANHVLAEDDDIIPFSEIADAIINAEGKTIDETKDALTDIKIHATELSEMIDDTIKYIEQYSHLNELM